MCHLVTKGNPVIIEPMWPHGLLGFFIGFVVGVFINWYLLRDVPRDKYLQDRSLRLRYGGLNWGIALLGMIIGLALR